MVSIYKRKEKVEDAEKDRMLSAKRKVYHAIIIIGGVMGRRHIS